MSKREVAELACRILALTLLVLNLDAFVRLPSSLVMNVGELVSSGRMSDVGIALAFAAIGSAFVLTVIWFLWTRADWIAGKVVPDNANYSRWPRIRLIDLQAAAFSTVGLITLIGAVEYLARSTGLFVGMLYYAPSGETVSLVQFLTMEWTIPSFVAGALGLWLLVGSRRLVLLLRRLRRSEAESDAPTPEEHEQV